MISLNKTTLVAACFIAGVSTSAVAIENQKTMCTHGGQSRVIEVVYSTDNNVPCEVQYTKAEGTKTLWSAQNKVGYCENKAAEFVAKQEGWGWSCELVSAKEETAAQ
ncbi:hypothetical protein CBF23_013540 [Marinomonas agarivorans]|nr:hypothetical protein CBF23_013540 [Marinomonas agarivorans]